MTRAVDVVRAVDAHGKIGVMIDAARRRHNALEILRALTRAERDPENVLRVF